MSLTPLVLYVLTCNMRRLEETSAVLQDLMVEDSLKPYFSVEDLGLKEGILPFCV